MYKISSFKTLWVSKMTIETVNTPKNYLFPIIYFRFSTNSNKSINFFSKWCPWVRYNVLRSTNWYNILLPYWNQIKNIFDPPPFNLFSSDFGNFQTGAPFQKILEGSKNFLALLSHPHPFLIGFQPLWNQFSKFSDIFESFLVFWWFFTHFFSLPWGGKGSQRTLGGGLKTVLGVWLPQQAQSVPMLSNQFSWLSD